MIRAEVTLWLANIEQVVQSEEIIDQWLLDNIGAGTPHRDQVSEEHPWCVTRRWAENIYHFARESDATLFKLRWA
jgi:hypothetical protein